jgi:hypothetical protein
VAQAKGGMGGSCLRLIFSYFPLMSDQKAKNKIVLIRRSSKKMSLKSTLMVAGPNHTSHTKKKLKSAV